MKIDLRGSPTGLAVAFAALIWLVSFFGYIAPNTAAGVYGPRDYVYLAVSSVLGAVFSVMFYASVAATRRLQPAPRLLGGFVALALLILAHVIIDLVILERYIGLPTRLGPRALMDARGVTFLNNLLLLAPTHVTYAAGVGLGLALRALDERERRLAAALTAAQEAQLAALRFQINPHFLFNSLNAVMALVGSGRTRDAETVVARLAEFFRATLSSEPNAMVTLEEEFDVLGAYLDIEAARFGERLIVELDLPEALRDACVPHFLLQPLAENAIKHAVAPSKRPVTVRIAARADAEGGLRLSVCDDGAAVPAAERAGAGVGLRNVAARLSTLYGEAGRLATGAQASGGFNAEAALPLAIAGRR